MKSIFYAFILCFITTVQIVAQAHTSYEISFENAIHHEADISIVYSRVESDTLSVRMSRSSPGRYAIHEFAKNVYGVKAFDKNGKNLTVTRPNPYQWDISGHQGWVKITYTLFGNHGDGTYSQIDETHAHLNMPATFMYAPITAQHNIRIKFHPRTDLNWTVATQLESLGNNEYAAPNLQYFMDSPVEISHHEIRSFEVPSGEKTYNINFVLHQEGEFEGLDAYVEKVKKIVLEEKQVFGELPGFDFGSYYFLACYAPNVDGDGMEHRNSTILTDLKPLSKGGDKENISTVAHEFFHSWNVERIRPASLEPFDFSRANMSGELWFAEGFTSYYTYLILCRTGIITTQQYINVLASVLSRVWNSPGTDYFGPVGMSFQAPFVDAATSVDQVNWENTFISYYTYGSVLGLALDLSLRNLKNDRSLDGFMKLAWEKFGKDELPYTLSDLQHLLSEYAGSDFSENFFNAYIYNSGMPDYKSLLASVGIELDEKYENLPELGAYIKQVDNKWVVSSNPRKGSSLYSAGLSKGDNIVSIDGKLTDNNLNTSELLASYIPGESVKVIFNRHGQQKEVEMTFSKDRSFKTVLMTDPAEEALKKQHLWLRTSK